MKVSRSEKSCLWNGNMPIVFECLIFSTFFNKCFQIYTDLSELALKRNCGRKFHRLHIFNFPKI